MNKSYISNAFSLNMMNEKYYDIHVDEMDIGDLDNIRNNVESVIGHKELADIFNFPCNRVSLALDLTDTLYVLQYSGPRLPEGATSLPENATIKLIRITF